MSQPLPPGLVLPPPAGSRVGGRHGPRMVLTVDTSRAPEILHEDHHQWVKAKIDGKTCLTPLSWVIVLYYGMVISVWTSRSLIILMFSWFSVD
ncbi:hypothetical protein PVAP13_8NG308900 [Panicum virgatum]|uniref:Uncharacterized protein n=1 Tax=Panicum virgatum TaxID=38727 RepID=A0A8T0PEY3_PANVG|nr:hypothetical protein PVAP13_8NG308900 [Panicum virgatum]